MCAVFGLYVFDIYIYREREREREREIFVPAFLTPTGHLLLHHHV